MRTGRAFGQFPFKTKQVFKKVIAPLGWCFCPGYFQSAGNGIGAFTRTITIVPAKALRFNIGCFGLFTYMVGSAAPWVLPKLCPPAISATVSSSFIAIRPKVSRMSLAAATGQGYHQGLQGLHRLSPFAQLQVVFPGYGNGYRHRHHRQIPVRHALLLRPVNHAHNAYIAAQPGGFRTPVYIFICFPYIFASAGKTKGFKAH
jgi:hypothetical protein